MTLSKHSLNRNEFTAQTIRGFPFRRAMFLLGNLLEPDLAGMKAIFLKAHFYDIKINLIIYKIGRQDFFLFFYKLNSPLQMLPFLM